VGFSFLGCLLSERAETLFFGPIVEGLFYSFYSYIVLGHRCLA
jgi:hypothetical protein